MSPAVPIIILIISIPMYFLCIWGFVKWGIGSERNRNLNAIIMTVILSPMVYIGIITVWISMACHYTSREFDEAGWNTNVYERYRMSRDIISSEMLIGKTLEEVIEILGEDVSIDGEEHVVYYLGFVPSILAIDPDVLDIYFRNGQVTRVEQHRT